MSKMFNSIKGIYEIFMEIPYSILPIFLFGCAFIDYPEHRNPAIYAFTATFVYAFIDVLIFYFSISRKETIETKDFVLGYRIFQVLLYILAVYIGYTLSPLCALFFIIYHWLGLSEHMYYIILSNKNHDEEMSMPWVRWTIIGYIYYASVKYDINLKDFKRVNKALIWLNALVMLYFSFNGF